VGHRHVPRQHAAGVQARPVQPVSMRRAVRRTPDRKRKGSPPTGEANRLSVRAPACRPPEAMARAGRPRSHSCAEALIVGPPARPIVTVGVVRPSSAARSRCGPPPAPGLASSAGRPSDMPARVAPKPGAAPAERTAREPLARAAQALERGGACRRIAPRANGSRPRLQPALPSRDHAAGDTGATDTPARSGLAWCAPHDRRPHPRYAPRAGRPRNGPRSAPRAPGAMIRASSMVLDEASRSQGERRNGTNRTARHGRMASTSKRSGFGRSSSLTITFPSKLRSGRPPSPFRASDTAMVACS
jgi:hypothetical protein